MNNCTITGNQLLALSTGGGILNHGGTVSLTNCIVAGMHRMIRPRVTIASSTQFTTPRFAWQLRRPRRNHATTPVLLP